MSHDDDDRRDTHDVLGPLPFGTSVIEASAGTGKTWTITSLYVRLVVEEGIAVERIVTLTFAKAAAAELTARVRERLREARAVLVRAEAQPFAPLPDDPVLRSLVADAEGLRSVGELSQRAHRARRALESLDAAAIATIHGFCLDVRSRWTFELGTTFRPRFVEDGRRAIADVVDDHLVRLSSQLSGPRFRRVRGSARLDRRSLRELAAAVARRPDARVIPPPIADERATDRSRDLVAAFTGWWRRGGRGAFLDEVANARTSGTLLGTTFGRTAAGKETAHFAKRLAALEAAIALPPEEAIDELGGVLLGEADFRTKLAADHELPVEGSWSRVMAFLEDARAHREDAPRAAFLSFVEGQLGPRRRRANEIGHDDLLLDLRAALRSTGSGLPLAEALRGAYEVVLIDEAQDTDQVQWDIFREVFHGISDKRLFLVGDPKQAIYGFRGADVRVYEAARAQTAPERQHTLRESYRSDGALVHALDVLWRDRGAVFEEPAPRYVRVRAAKDLHPWTSLDGADGGTGPAALQIRWFDGRTFDPSSDRLTLGKGEALEVLPALVAGDVAHLLDGGTTRHRGGRPASRAPAAALAPRDIAILVRTNLQAAALAKALAARGLPAVIAAAGNVFEGEEAGWLSRWLLALSDPRERTARAWALTPLGGYSVRTLFDAVNQLDDRWAGFLDRLVEQRTLFLERGFAVAFRACLEAPADDPLTALARAAGGERALTNLRQLEEHLQAQERTLGRSPAALHRWLSAQRDGEGEPTDDAELRLESDRDAVRITTVHGSKGLEYPIVFAPYAWDGALPRGGGPTIFHERDATGRPTARTVVDARHGKGAPGKETHKRWAREEALAESLRLFYVASTRARHQLVLYAGAVSSHGDTGGFATSPLGIVLLGGRDPQAAPGTRAAIAQAEIGQRLESNDRHAFRTVVDDLAALAERTRPPGGLGATGPEVSWDDAPPRLAVRDAARSGPRRGAAITRLAVAPFTRGPALASSSAWQRASYTSLTSRAPHLAPPHALGSLPAELPPVPLATFPRGPAVGIFVHALLERLDFRAARERDDAHHVARATGGRDLVTFAREEATLFGVADDAAALLARQLPAILASPLGPEAGNGLLRDLGPNDRLDELAFDLSVAGGAASGKTRANGVVRGGDLTATIAGSPAGEDAAHPWPARYTEVLTKGTLDIPSFAGLLTGSLDLVYRVPGEDGEHRYFVADYKTNWLGEVDASGRARSTARHYETPALVEEMIKHHYFIQAYLYLVALHRFLRSRLGPAYAYERHVGGAVYLFVRGMGLGEGSPRGVVTLRPPRATIEALDSLLANGSAP